MAEREISISSRTGSQARIWLQRLGNNALVQEGVALLGLYLLYSLGRWWVAYDCPYKAFTNAFKIVELERQLGIFYEPVIQKTLIDHALGVVYFANWFYVAGYFPVLVLTGVSLYRFHRDRFRFFKRVFSLGLGLALIGYTLFPLAPPRMLAGVGLVDTQQMYGPDLGNEKTFLSLYNPYAAMPSMHFGCALMIGIMAFGFKRRIVRIVGLLYPGCMAGVIVASGHHYLLDVVAGGAVVLLACGLVKVFVHSKRKQVLTGRGARLADSFKKLSREPKRKMTSANRNF